MSEYISKEDISRVLLDRTSANKSCLSRAREKGLHVTEYYFQNLVFEDEQITSLIEGLSSASFPDSKSVINKVLEVIKSERFKTYDYYASLAPSLGDSCREKFEADMEIYDGVIEAVELYRDSASDNSDSAENKGDLISRQAVLDELEKWDWQELYLPIHFKQILDDIHSADVRPNIHGHWEEDGHGHIICSACKEANVSTWKSRFCPMCGADMRGDILPKYEAKVITRGNCMMCGKELDKGLFFCEECESRAESEVS